MMYMHCQVWMLKTCIEKQGRLVENRLIITSAWTFMVEENTVTGKDIVGLSVVDYNPVTVQLGNT